MDFSGGFMQVIVAAVADLDMELSDLCLGLFPVTAEFLQARDLGPAVLKEVEERDIELVLFGARYNITHGVYSAGANVTYLLEHTPCPIWVLREEIPSIN